MLRSSVEYSAEDWELWAVTGGGDGQWPCLRLAWSRGRATAARAPVGGVSGARIRGKQARARGEGLGGVRRPSGGKELGSAAA